MNSKEIPFTLNEKTVLWALTKWPTANDRQLALLDRFVTTITLFPAPF